MSQGSEEIRPAIHPKLGQVITLFCLMLVIAMAIWIRALIRGYTTDLGDILDFWPLFLIVALLPLSWIIKRKDPRAICLPKAENAIELVRGKERIKLDIDVISFSVSGSSIHKKLTIYRKVRATRGHMVHKRLHSILAPSLGFGWKPSHLDVLKSSFIALGMEEVAASNEGFIDDLLN